MFSCGQKYESERGDFRSWHFFQLPNVILTELLDVLVPKVLTRKMGVILYLLPACLFRLSDLQYKGCLLLCMMPEKQGLDSVLAKRHYCYANYNLKLHWRYFKNKKIPRIGRFRISPGKKFHFGYAAPHLNFNSHIF